MKIPKGFFASQSVHWATPQGTYAELDQEFCFNDDPCPLHGKGGLDRAWGKRTFVNPPYGVKNGLRNWLEKGIRESKKGKIIVFLLPVRSDAKWFHDLILPYAKEIRFIKGRLKFGKAKSSAPFGSMVVIYSK